MLGIFNGTATTFLIGIGHDLGIFDSIAGLEPMTSEGIAKTTNLDERYVREWLNGLVVGEVVSYDAQSKTYTLAPEHAALLTRAAGPDNIASVAQYFPMMGQVAPKVEQAFKTGGGVPYSEYPRFQELQAAESAPIYDAALVDAMIPLAGGLTKRLEEGIDVLEFGVGGGHALNVLAAAFPNSRFTGIDISDDGIAIADDEAKRRGNSNLQFKVEDAAKIEGSYDLILAFDVVHDLAFPSEVLASVSRALREDGTFFMMDIDASSNVEENVDHPLGPTLYFFSVFHCMTVSLAQGGVGMGTAWGRQTATRVLEEAGFETVEAKTLPGDFMHVFYIARK